MDRLKAAELHGPRTFLFCLQRIRQKIFDFEPDLGLKLGLKLGPEQGSIGALSVPTRINKGP